MRNCLRVLACLLTVTLLLAGCGGSVHKPVHKPVHLGATGITIIVGHACSPADQVMQCVLPPASNLRSAGPVVTSGIDFAWSCPSPVGHGFGASYLSSDPSKNWTPACLNLWHAHHAATVAVYETAADRAKAGCAAGAQDARSAAGQLVADHAPARQPFDMAIDFDATGPDVAPYFQCASQAEPGRVNAYGGAGPIIYLWTHHLVGSLNWVTYAWLYRNGGVFPSPAIAPLRQVLNGSAVDYDVALLPNYGQWPFLAPRPPGPTPSQVAGYRKARDSSLAAYHAQHCTMPVLGRASCQAFATRVVRYQLLIPGPRPECWGAHAQLRAAVCQIVRPRTSIRSHARDASFRAYERHDCQGPGSWGMGVQSPLCDRLRQRHNYFVNIAGADLKEF